jgi:hypothetical protein
MPGIFVAHPKLHAACKPVVGCVRHQVVALTDFSSFRAQIAPRVDRTSYCQPKPSPARSDACRTFSHSGKSPRLPSRAAPILHGYHPPSAKRVIQRVFKLNPASKRRTGGIAGCGVAHGQGTV